MDLSLLEHLSHEALRKEAERRHLVLPEDLDRASIIEAIRRSATSLPPAAPSKVPVQPVQTSRFGAARQMLGKALGLAREVIERRSSRPPPPMPEPKIDEPIRTRTMADLLISQGEVGRALSILEELLRDHPTDTALEERVVSLRARVHGDRALEKAKARSNEPAPFVDVVTVGEAHAAAWSIDDAGLERARTLLEAEGELTLRVVTVKAVDGAPAREREDHTVQRSGARSLGSGARFVVSVGLASEDRFVSIAHAAS